MNLQQSAKSCTLLRAPWRNLGPREPLTYGTTLANMFAMSTDASYRLSCSPASNREAATPSESESGVLTTVLNVLRVVVGMSDQHASEQLEYGIHIDGNEFLLDAPTRLRSGSIIVVDKTKINVISPHLRNLRRDRELIIRRGD